jgi:hypothetical protein
MADYSGLVAIKHVFNSSTHYLKRKNEMIKKGDVDHLHYLQTLGVQAGAGFIGACLHAVLCVVA